MAAESFVMCDTSEASGSSRGPVEGAAAGPPSAGIDHVADDPQLSQPTGLAAGPVSTANEVLEKLASLDVARKAERERRREESRAAADPRESVAQFLQGFNSRQRRIEAALQDMLLQQQPQQPTNPQQQQQNGQAQGAPPVQPASPAVTSSDAPLPVSAASPEQVQASLELLSAEVLSLEQSAAAASYYLPLYDQKQCAATVAALRAGIDGARTALAPRRRFAFGSKKVNKVRGEEISAAAVQPQPQSGPGLAQAGHAAPSPLPSASLSQPAAEPPHPPSASAPAGLTAAAASSSAAGPSACGNGTSGDPAAAAARVGSTDASADAPASLVVSEQDRALVARGRGLMGLADAEVVLRAEEVEEGAAGGAAGGDFVLLGLTRCRVVVVGRLRALRLAGLRGCTLVAGPVTGAVFADDVRGCSMSLAAYQVRVHRTHATDLFLRVRSKPIIEHSTAVRVAPWAAGVAREPRLEALLQAHKLGEADDTGCWQQVDDFGWIKAVQSPNWGVMPESARPKEPLAVPESVWERRASVASGADATVDEI